MQRFGEDAGLWFEEPRPLWLPEVEYREKPTKSPQELEKESIISDMADLQKRLDKLEVGS